MGCETGTRGMGEMGVCERERRRRAVGGGGALYSLMLVEKREARSG